MTTAELKTDLHKDIDKINDDEKLEKLKILVENYFLRTGEPDFTEDQLRSLNISREQSKKGEFITNEDIDNEIDEWLNK